jgi:hypothetical protein
MRRTSIHHQHQHTFYPSSSSLHRQYVTISTNHHHQQATTTTEEDNNYHHQYQEPTIIHRRRFRNIKDIGGTKSQFSQDLATPLQLTNPTSKILEEKDLKAMHKKLVLQPLLNVNIDSWNNMFNTLIQCCQNSELVKTVVSDFEHFIPTVSIRNASLHNNLLQLYLKFYDVDKAVDFVKKSYEKGFDRFDLNVLHNVLDGLFKQSDPSDRYADVFSFFDIMRSMFIVPTIESYNLIIQLHVQLNNIQTALDILDDLLSIDVIRTDVNTFSSIIVVLCNREPDDLLFSNMIYLLQHMRKTLKITGRELHNMICSYLYRHQNKFIEYLNTVDREDNVEYFSFIITALSYSTMKNISTLQMCEGVYEIMKSKKILGDKLEPENALIRAAVRDENIEYALSIFRSLTKPSTETLDLLIYGYSRVGDHETADGLVELRKQHK